ncbi:hypothetical protein F7725_004654 [Dissostichus mawsoni]|uniref:Transglutaminase-like domain-containing protein n=1 Tax=Dissostichus mawsoni TaxID=36200 RepID=A0A7J5XJN8_DISMA|nr:hypothetical protein F7725_004654 [Dissostichus mawsoni]
MPPQTIKRVDSSAQDHAFLNPPPRVIAAMSDPGATATPSPAPPPPTGPRPKMTSSGRSAVPISTSNSDSTDIPEFEPFGLPGPRGFPPLTDYLDILGVDMMRRPEENNKQQHHTNLYNSDYLVVRRGQEFEVKITFNRPYKPASDNKGTYTPVFPHNERPSPWEGRITNTADDTVTMGVTADATCTVGKYQMYVAVVTPFGIRRTRKDKSRDLYILFNPWASERDECVMNEMGIIYHGAYDDVAERNWNYGQFNFGVLDACLYIMDRSDMPITNRGDPIRVTRKASAMLNSRDDEGVLVGNWSGDYTYGVAPFLDRQHRHPADLRQRKDARLLRSVLGLRRLLRCLGIPSRVVTNFYSAHDNDGNLKMDIILDENGRIDRSRTKDSIWNYHCWNECYMSRPDLPAGFGGWQVVDATPQETSDGMYRCGPASVQAIKHGQICFPFDAAFVFAEVNSDVVFYSRNKDGTMEPVRVNRTHIGRMVLTKSQGDMTRREITDQYKFPEGSTEERTVLEKAEEYGCKRDKSELPAADVDLILPTLEVSVGDDFEMSLEFVNRSDERRTVDIYISGSVVFYTGVTTSEFLFRNPTVTIGPNKSVKESVTVESKAYMKHLVEQANINFIATGKVQETGQIITAMKVVTLHNPKLTVTMTATVEFTNPFSFSLEGVYIRMEGPGIMLPKSKYYSLIQGRTSLSWTEYFTPQRAGSSRVIASLDCPALRQVLGQASVTVKP